MYTLWDRMKKKWVQDNFLHFFVGYFSIFQLLLQYMTMRWRKVSFRIHIISRVSFSWNSNEKLKLSHLLLFWLLNIIFVFFSLFFSLLSGQALNFFAIYTPSKEKRTIIFFLSFSPFLSLRKYRDVWFFFAPIFHYVFCT